MPSLAPGVIGAIEMDRASSRVEPYFEPTEESTAADDLIHLARGGSRREGRSGDASADEVLLADLDRLAEELDLEYEVLRAVVAKAQA